MVRQAGHQVIEFAMQHPDNLPSCQSDYFPTKVDYHDRHGLLDRLKIAARFIHHQEACERLAALIRAERPDIVHFHNIYHQLTPSIIRVAKELGCKTVLTAHDYKVACPNYSMLVKGQPSISSGSRVPGSSCFATSGRRDPGARACCSPPRRPGSSGAATMSVSMLSSRRAPSWGR